MERNDGRKVEVMERNDGEVGEIERGDRRENEEMERNYAREMETSVWGKIQMADIPHSDIFQLNPPSRSVFL